MAITRAQQARQMLQDGNQVLGPLREDNLQTDFISGARGLLTPGNIGRGLAFVLSGGATSAADIAKEIARQKILNEIQDKAGDVIGPRVETKLIQQQNEASGTGGYQSDFSQDSDFMGGSGTAAEMGSFADGGRIGLSNGSYDEEVGVNTPDRRQTYDSPAQNFSGAGVSPVESTYDAPTGAVDDKFSGGQKMSRETGGQGTETFYVGQSPDYEFSKLNTTGYDEETGVTTPPRSTVTGGGDGGADDSLQALYDRGIPDSNLPGFLGLGMDLLKKPRNFSLRKNIDYFRGLQNIDRSVYPETVEGYTQYMADRSAGIIDAAGNRIRRDDDQPIIPIQTGIMTQDSLTTDQETDEKVEEPFERALAFRADGGRIGAQEGGIMNANVVGGEFDFESARQMYGLGKLVKKVTRSVKKIAKSPIGKAALLYAGTAGLGALGAGAAKAGTGFGIFAPSAVKANLGTAFTRFMGGKLMSDPIGLYAEGQVGKQNLLQRAIGAIPGSGVTAAITAASLLPLLGLGTGEETEEEAEELIRGSGLDINAIRANPNQFLARRFRAEGGSMKEPVAKKTMPLLDLDGKEMDLRAEGGFVPIGRMERADDVPARLSKNEFVFTADAVRNAGDGDVDKGAEVMYNMMKNLESGGDVSEESQGLEGARKMFQTSKRLEEVL